MTLPALAGFAFPPLVGFALPPLDFALPPLGAAVDPVEAFWTGALGAGLAPSYFHFLGIASIFLVLI